MRSRHPRLRTLPDNLFRGLSSFRELEARIAALPEELHRGDAFEVFVEAYLWTTLVWQVADLWLVGQVPLDVRRELNLPADAKGIDGVVRTRSGGLVPYQVKYRIGRPHVGVTEVATFLGLTDRATDRVLISNADRFAPDVEIRDYLRLLRGADFDALTADDFAAIEAWLDHRPVAHRHATPFPHQVAALSDIALTLSTHDRATVVMACGTGKTLVGLWLAEQRSPHTVLVLVPSLALLSQALGDWSRETSWGERFEYLCVCSDPSVSAEQDATQVRSTDVPFHVDTDPAMVRRFLDRPATGSVHVVFSTYQSAPIVAAGMSSGSAFDLGIFDEAHKTAGLRDGVFGFGLDDARLRIRKRVFFTATPRHIDIRHRDKDGDFRVVSMDNPAVYGPRAHTLSFADAVAQGLICDYRVVVSVVDPAEVSAFALAHGITLVKGDQQGTQWVAAQIAVSKAIAETGAKKVITFHSRVNQAKEFASDGPRGIGQYLDGFIVDHVNGTLRVADRKDVLSGFKDGQRRLVTNARCLTEGVDLPAVDMVVFSNPRKSRVDIIQAVGRAMRKSRGGNKAVGYVVVPILLAPHEADDLEAASRETDWEDIVEVLAALREHDTRLEDLIRDAQIAKGRGEVFNPRMLAERVRVLGPQVALEALERYIGTVLLERLGVSWDLSYGQLLTFRTLKGHCNVSALDSDWGRLGEWVLTQRRAKRRGVLSSERTQQLEALGFEWEPWVSEWEKRCEQLVAFKQRHGHCDVPKTYGSNRLLGVWVATQKVKWGRGLLSADRVDRLTALGFVWSMKDAQFERRFSELEMFKLRHRHCDVRRTDSDFPGLGMWLINQRTDHRTGTLLPDRAARLESLGVVWNLKDAEWARRFEELRAFLQQEGHCDVPREYSTNLGKWLGTQRQNKKNGTLSQDRFERLGALGVQWNIVDAVWEKRCEELVAFKEREGHCNVPALWEDNPGLGRWLTKIRMSMRDGTLLPDRAARLESLGVVWNPTKRK